MSIATGVIRCPTCGKQFHWNSRFAGRKARCACGSVMDYPAAPSVPDLTDVPDAPDDAAYDLVPERPVASAPQPLSQVAVDEATPPPVGVLAYRSTRAAAMAADLDVEKLTKQTLPLWLLTGGLLAECAITFFRAKFWWSDPNLAILHLLFNVGLSTIVMMIGVLIAAKVRQISIGSLPSAMLRLAALIIATDAVSDLLTPAAYFIPAGGIVLLLANFALYFALLGTLFDLDEDDTWYCVCVIFILHVALYFALLFLVR